MTIRKLLTIIILIALVIFFFKSDLTTDARLKLRNFISELDFDRFFASNPAESIPFSDADKQNARIDINDLEYEHSGLNPPSPINKPNFTSWASSGFGNDEKIIGISINGQARAYPYYILYRHKIINDVIDGQPIAVTYSPTCDTNPVFLRTIGGEVTTFGDTGILYQGCMVMKDANTNTYWSQPWGTGIIGQNVNIDLLRIPAISTTLGKWKDTYPDAIMLSKNTGLLKDYLDNPYEDYKKTEELIYKTRNTELLTSPAKEPISYIWIPGAENTFNQFSGESAYLTHRFVQENGKIRLIFNSMEMAAVWDEYFETVRFITSDGREMPSSTGYAFAYFALFE